MSARSVYVSRLRRAFLLRVHPDRFLAQHQRRQQAALVQALANRMARPDFGQWQSQAQSSQSQQSSYFADASSSTSSCTYPYVLEKRDGSFLKTSISLATDVESILTAMATALEQSGAAKLPKPASSAEPTNTSHAAAAPSESSDTLFPGFAMGYSRYGGGKSRGTIDHRYDVQSNRGRRLRHFLKRILDHDHEVIQQRRQHRVEAQAVARQVRQCYGFAAVDAVTDLGWSSQSVAVLLRRLLDLHREYFQKTNDNNNQHHPEQQPLLSSFYPLRLQFSPREVPGDLGDCLDVYAGVLRLNPASTSLQWLDALRFVTAHKLRVVVEHRRRLACAREAGQAALRSGGAAAVKLRQGHSCSSREFFAFLERLGVSAALEKETGATDNNDETSPQEQEERLPALEPLTAVVESDAACRRPKVTERGWIRLGAGMDLGQCRDAVGKLSSRARTAATHEQESLQQCRRAVRAVQWRLGVQRVYRVLPESTVPHPQFLDCLARLLRQAAANEASSVDGGDEDGGGWSRSLAGNSLGIAGAGQFCHLADDGSLVIPHNWTL